jgi:hypothetical protein
MISIARRVTKIINYQNLSQDDLKVLAKDFAFLYFDQL